MTRKAIKPTDVGLLLSLMTVILKCLSRHDASPLDHFLRERLSRKDRRSKKLLGEWLMYSVRETIRLASKGPGKRNTIVRRLSKKHRKMNKASIGKRKLLIESVLTQNDFDSL